MIIHSPMQTPCYDILGDSFNQAMQRRLATAAESSTIISVLLSSTFSDCRIVGSYISLSLIDCCCRRHSDWFYSTRLCDRWFWRRLATVEETMEDLTEHETNTFRGKSVSETFYRCLFN